MITRKRTRKPANAVEAQALDYWQDARPGMAMGTLAHIGGYNRDARAEFLATVVGLSADDIPDYVNMLPDPVTPDTGDADTCDAGEGVDTEGPAIRIVTAVYDRWDYEDGGDPYHIHTEIRPCTPDEYDREEGYPTPALVAAREIYEGHHLQGPYVASAMGANGEWPGGRVWYQAEPHKIPGTNDLEVVSIHLVGFTEEQAMRVWSLVTSPDRQIYRERLALARA